MTRLLVFDSGIGGLSVAIEIRPMMDEAYDRKLHAAAEKWAEGMEAARADNPFGVQMGMTMLANTERGGMLTNAQVTGWLRDAGFEAARLIEPIGFNFVYVAATPPAAHRPGGSA